MYSQTQIKFKPDSVVIHPSVDTRIDNNQYWNNMAQKGLVKIIPNKNIELIIEHIGSQIKSELLSNRESVDIMIGSDQLMQSENSVFVDPNDYTKVLTSMNIGNSTDAGFDYCKTTHICGTDYNISNNSGLDWDRFSCIENNDVLPENGGDPSVCISAIGTQYVGYITVPPEGSYFYGGQGVSFLKNDEENWTDIILSNPPNLSYAMLDKNHLSIDNSSTSVFNGNLYDSWTYFNSYHNNDENDGEIQLFLSTDEGYSWNTPNNPSDGFISSAVEAGSHNQGVNVQTGPNGEVYAVWSIYDSWPSDESAFGFSRSIDGGENWNDAIRVVENIEGIRDSGAGITTDVNSYPSMAVDISKGHLQGTIYVVFALKDDNDEEEYGINIFLIKSIDNGITWSLPSQINIDNPYLDNEQSFFPWISCDPETGILSVVFYKGNFSHSGLEVKAANSFDGGITWDEFTISDNTFTPRALLGDLNSGYVWRAHYFGDYLGLSSLCGKVYPTWTANLICEGSAETYVSPYQIGDEDLFLDGLAESKVYFANNSITASNQNYFTINENNKTSLTSGNNILMKSGFHAKQGSVFSAYTCNCGTERGKSSGNLTAQFNNSEEIMRLNMEKDEIQISVFPNPSNSKINVFVDHGTTNECYFELFNIKGQLVKSGFGLTDNSIIINLYDLPNNIYFLKIISGNSFLVEKIIKQ